MATRDEIDQGLSAYTSTRGGQTTHRRRDTLTGDVSQIFTVGKLDALIELAEDYCDALPSDPEQIGKVLERRVFAEAVEAGKAGDGIHVTATDITRIPRRPGGSSVAVVSD